MTEASHEEKLPGGDSARRLLQALLSDEFTKLQENLRKDFSKELQKELSKELQKELSKELQKELSKEFDLREIRLRDEFSVLKKQMAKLRETQIDQERSHHSELLAAAYAAEGALLPRMRHVAYSGSHFKQREKDKKQASIFST